MNRDAFFCGRQPLAVLAARVATDLLTQVQRRVWRWIPFNGSLQHYQRGQRSMKISRVRTGRKDTWKQTCLDNTGNTSTEYRTTKVAEEKRVNYLVNICLAVRWWRTNLVKLFANASLNKIFIGHNMRHFLMDLLRWI